ARGAKSFHTKTEITHLQKVFYALVLVNPARRFLQTKDFCVASRYLMEKGGQLENIRVNILHNFVRSQLNCVSFLFLSKISERTHQSIFLIPTGAWLQ